MNTKEKIMHIALDLFSVRGFSAVSVHEIAKEVGIKAPSLYKHYKSKQDIFEAILLQMQKGYQQEAQGFALSGVDPNVDVKQYIMMSEVDLLQLGKQLFHYFLKDEFVVKVRKMITLEQFHNKDLADFYSLQYFHAPIEYQATLFQTMMDSKIFRQEDPKVMALHFYAPLFLLLTLCDRNSDQEQDAFELLEAHIKQFSRLYKN